MFYLKTWLMTLMLLSSTLVSASWANEPQPPAPSLLSKINGAAFSILFADMAFGNLQIPKVDQNNQTILDDAGNPVMRTVAVPFLICVLFLGAVFFTFWYKFISLRGFRHAVDITRGKYDNPADEGDVSHFKALTSALSATVGLGNIAGVAIAIQVGGPGVVVWMMIAAVFGMSSKFSSCTLSQLYRKFNADGTVSGGPMYYLDLGFADMGKHFAKIGKILAVLYAIMVMGGSIGGGNMFQANQTVEAFVGTLEAAIESSDGDFKNSYASWDKTQKTEFKQKIARGVGIVLMLFVSAVVLGGIRRIGNATSKIVPFMCGIYVIASLFILITHVTHIPDAFATIFTMAFSQNAFYGGMIGVMVMGIQRASFSNEAGLGSAAIAHAAAKTKEPVREGLVAMLEPFIDTIIICTMTALVVIITGAYNDPSIPASAGVTLTTKAFGSVIDWFPYVLTGCIALFAYSTMISWCYYGERGWIYLIDTFGGNGIKSLVIFRVVFILFIYVGAVNKLGDVIDFSDVMILSMAFPNIVGSIILAPMVRRKVNVYWQKYTTGAFEKTTR